MNSTIVRAVALVFALSLIACLAQQSLPGGYSSAAVTNKEVMKAAAFAVKAQQKVMQSAKESPSAKLKLAAILGAEQQVVAGVNYRLRLKVKVDGKEKEAEAVVWWQAWRKPEPYKLTSWEWK